MAGEKVQVNKNDKGVAIHGDDPDFPRPPYKSVEWQGSVFPNNSVDHDTWVRLAPS